LDCLIKLENICFEFSNEKKVLNNLNFQLNKNEKVALKGENGSGKTTLFHIIMGLLQPQKGNIYLFGNLMKSEKDFRNFRTKIGLLFQDSDDQLFSPSVLDDVAFGPLNIGYKGDEARKIAENTLRDLNIYHLRDRVTYKLSGGEKRMVALATILSMSPEVLLLDEPTNGIDEKHLKLLTDFLKNTSLSFIIISHDENFLNEVTDKSYILKNGKIKKSLQ
jgi:cobalt/nickel transport system ATP-binding protein